MDDGIISLAFAVIGFIIFFSAFIRLGNVVVELRKLNKQFEQFLKQFETPQNK